MNERASLRTFRVRGENAPGWLPSGLGLAGLIGSIITAQMLLSDWHDEFARWSRRMEVGASSAQLAPPTDEMRREEIPIPSDLGDDESQAKLDRESNRQQAAANTSLVVEQISVTPITVKPPLLDTIAEEYTAQSAGADSELQAMPPSTLGATAGIGSTTPDTGRAEQTGSPSTEPHSAEPGEARDSPLASKSDTKGQAKEMQAHMQHLDDTDSAPMIDKAAIDCAPLFSVGFNHGSIVPRDRNIDKKIKRLAHWLKAHPTAMVYVDGHADSSGPEEVNLVISFRRATAIAALLTQAGATDAQLVVRAYGENRFPSPSTKPARERRVTLRSDAGMSCDHVSDNGGHP